MTTNEKRVARDKFLKAVQFLLILLVTTISVNIEFVF